MPKELLVGALQGRCRSQGRLVVVASVLNAAMAVTKMFTPDCGDNKTDCPVGVFVLCML